MGAAALAKAVGVKVYTIGAGTNGMAPVRATDPFGRERLVRIPVQIDEVTLKAIAEDTGGQYYRATDFDRLQQIYAEIDELERTGIEPNSLSGIHGVLPPCVVFGFAIGVVGCSGRFHLFFRRSA